MAIIRHVFTREFLKELTTTAAIWPITAMLAAILKIDSSNFEWFVVPLLLGYFSARKWKSDSLWWPFQLPVWKLLFRWVAVTSVLIFLPITVVILAALSLIEIFDGQSVSGRNILYVAPAFFAVGGAVVFPKKCKQIIYAIAALSDSDTSQRRRFFGFWLGSILLIFWVVRGDEPTFDKVCSHAEKYASWVRAEPDLSLSENNYRSCLVSRTNNRMNVQVEFSQGDYIQSRRVEYRITSSWIWGTSYSPGIFSPTQRQRGPGTSK